MVEEQECVGNEVGPAEHYLLEAQVEPPQQLCDLGYTYGQMDRIGSRLDTKMEKESSQEGRSGTCTDMGIPFVATTDQKDRWPHSSHERKRTGSLC